MIRIDTPKDKIDISKDNNKGYIILSITTQYLQKIKLNRKLDRKSLKLTTHYNDRFVTNHNCSITNITEYQKKIFDNITKLKEIWKNNYKDNKM